MLRKLLCLAVGQDTAEATALARELGVSARQVLQMIETLEHLGFLEEVVTGCGRPCERCPVREAGVFRHRPRLWTLTRKGEKFLATEVEGRE
jgi:predicted ArsR family transcriptional regulator